MENRTIYFPQSAVYTDKHSGSAPWRYQRDEARICNRHRCSGDDPSSLWTGERSLPTETRLRSSDHPGIESADVWAAARRYRRGTARRLSEMDGAAASSGPDHRKPSARETADAVEEPGHARFRGDFDLLAKPEHGHHGDDGIPLRGYESAAGAGAFQNHERNCGRKDRRARRHG